MNYTDNQHDEVTSPIILEIWQKQIIEERLTDYYNTKKFMDILTENRDIVICQKIYDTLWFDWDPLGINDIAPRDEYKSYVFEIHKLVKSKAERQTIAEHLFKIETINMAKGGSIEKCHTIAEKILKVV